MNVTDLYYNFPEAAYLIFIVLLFLFLFWIFYRYRMKILASYSSSEKFSELALPQPTSTYWIKTAGYCLAWLCLCLALMQPKGNARYPQEALQAKKSINALRLKPHEVIFLIDASASMSVPDGRLGLARLDNAKDIADQVMSRLKGQSGSLYAFTSEVSKLSPPSMDYLFMRLMLRNLSINEGDVNGTDLKAALRYIQENYLKQKTPFIKTLVILSDGEDNHLEDLKGQERETYMREITDLLGNPTESQLHVYTIGVGTQKGGDIPKLTYEGKGVVSHLNEDLLKAISNKGQGRYYSGNEYAAIDIATDLATQITKADVFAPVGLEGNSVPQEDLIYDLYFQFPLGLAILLLGLCIFLPDTYVLKGNTLKPIYPYAMGVILLLLPLRLWGENYEEQLHLGAAYVSAKDYSAAIQVYQSLLKENLSSWERSVVLYNLGTALTDGGNEENAIENFQSVTTDRDTSPVLDYRLKRNLAMANFRQGKTLSQEIHAVAPSPDTFFKAIYFFKQALEELSLAQKAQCHLYHAAEEETCPQNTNLEEVKALSKMGIALMHDQARKNLVEHATLQQGLPWLTTGLQFIEQDIHYMLDNSMPSNLQANYQKLFSQQAESWKPLWKALQTQISANKKYEALFEKAQANFNRLLIALIKGNFNEAKKKLEETRHQINELMHLVFAEDPFQEVMASLQNDFSLAALQDPLESNTLLFLQQKLNELTVPTDHHVYQVGIDAIKDNLEHSLAALQKHTELIGQMYFNEAQQQIKRILLLLNPGLQDNPENVLLAGIEEQHHALNQTRLLSRLVEKQEKIPAVALTFVIASQQYLPNFSDYFYQAAYAYQKKEFGAEVPKGSKDLRCQYHPWNEVLPLFQQGIDGIKKTVKLLNAQDKSIQTYMTAMHAQENVLSVWNEALAKLKAPKSGEGCHASPLMNKPEQGISQPQSFENTARLIQQMNAEDQQPMVPSGHIKEGLKPW